MTQTHQRLLDVTRGLYGVLLPALPADRGHCLELSHIGSTLASLLGLEHSICGGTRPWLGNRDLHNWIALDNLILHSPRRGEVELIKAAGADFETTNATRITLR
jgi:hypothetical protein